MAGRRTPQHLAVQENYVMLQRTLRATDDAGETLLALFKGRGWLDQLVQTKADGLIKKALNKIENDVENYEVFIEMLKEVSGIEEAVRKITGKCPVKSGKGPAAGGGSGVLGSDSPGSAEVLEGEAFDMMCYTDWMTLVEKDDSRAAELWVVKGEDLWPARKKLKVRFLKVIPPWLNEGRRGYITEDEILKIANEWHQCGVEQGNDVVPEFVPCGPNDTSDIRVKFIDSGCPRSKVGTAAARVKAGEPTMWLDLKSPDDCPSRYKRTIRHEFGHALGLKHEHQSPNAPRLADIGKLRELLRQYYPGFTHEQIERKIRVQWAALAGGASQKSNYDKKSVMHYLIPEGVRAKGYAGPTRLPFELSECDKKSIVVFYSKREVGRAAVYLGDQTDMDTSSGTGGDNRGNGAGGSIVDDSGENAQEAAKPSTVPITSRVPDILSKSPTLSQLLKLKYVVDGVTHEMEIIPMLAKQWNTFGVAGLGIESYKVDVCEGRNDGESCCNLFKKFLQSGSKKFKNPTWQSVIKAMKDRDLIAADELENKALPNMIYID